MKKFLKENKVLCVLFIVVILCIAIVGIISLKYFYGSSDNVYGDRLDDLEPISKETLNNLKDKLDGEKTVLSHSETNKGRVFYINMVFQDNTEMDKAKEFAGTLLDIFNEDELKEYDLQFTISSNKGEVKVDEEETKDKKKKDSKKEEKKEFEAYTLMGSKNASGSDEIVWNNYNMSYKENDVVEE